MTQQGKYDGGRDDIFLFCLMVFFRIKFLFASAVLNRVLNFSNLIENQTEDIRVKAEFVSSWFILLFIPRLGRTCRRRNREQRLLRDLLVDRVCCQRHVVVHDHLHACRACHLLGLHDRP